jgi:hypothetical protein
MKLVSSTTLCALALACIGADAVSVRQSADEKVVGAVELTLKNGDFSGEKIKEAYIQIKAMSASFYKTDKMDIKDSSNVDFSKQPKALGM